MKQSCTGGIRHIFYMDYPKVMRGHLLHSEDIFIEYYKDTQGFCSTPMRELINPVLLLSSSRPKINAIDIYQKLD